MPPTPKRKRLCSRKSFAPCAYSQAVSTDPSADRSSAVSGMDCQAFSSWARIPARNSGSTDRLWLNRSISYLPISAPGPGRVRMAEGDLLLEHLGRAVADRPEQGDPVEQLAAYVAGPLHAFRGRLRDQFGGLPL